MPNLLYSTWHAYLGVNTYFGQKHHVILSLPFYHSLACKNWLRIMSERSRTFVQSFLPAPYLDQSFQKMPMAQFSLSALQCSNALLRLSFLLYSSQCISRILSRKEKADSIYYTTDCLCCTLKLHNVPKGRDRGQATLQDPFVIVLWAAGKALGGWQLMLLRSWMYDSAWDLQIPATQDQLRHISKLSFPREPASISHGPSDQGICKHDGGKQQGEAEGAMLFIWLRTSICRNTCLPMKSQTWHVSK